MPQIDARGGLRLHHVFYLERVMVALTKTIGRPNIFFFHLHNIRRICKYLDQESLLTLTHAFITSRLDYCNSLLYGAPVTQIEKLQRIQNAAARLITRSPKFCHMGPILRQLHWLPIRSRIHHKILTLTFKSIHGLAPSYLSELITTSRPSRYSLRSSQSTMLIHPPAKMLSTLGDRTFSTAAPQLWNRLPPALRNQLTLLQPFQKSTKIILILLKRIWTWTFMENALYKCIIIIISSSIIIISKHRA